MKYLLTAVMAVTLLTLPTFSQSKEQREAAKQYPLTMRVKAERDDSKMSKSGGGNNSGSSTKTQEVTKHWTVTVDCKSTNFTEKVELRTHYVGTQDGEFAILGSNKYPVQFDEKGRSKIDVTSPTARLTKSTKQSGGQRGKMEKTVSGQRLNGLIAQLAVNGTIIKTFVTQSAWAKGAWKDDLSEDDIRPGAPKKKE